MLDYRILGPLEVSADGQAIEIRGPKQRALLAILLLRANEPVSRDVLVHELWGEQPPAGFAPGDRSRHVDVTLRLFEDP